MLKRRKRSFKGWPASWNIENYHLRGDLPLETLKMVICYLGANLPLETLKMIIWKATYFLKHRNWSLGSWHNSKCWNFKIDHLKGDLPLKCWSWSFKRYVKLLKLIIFQVIYLLKHWKQSFWRRPISWSI
jgi:hypothetical protein